MKRRLPYPILWAGLVAMWLALTSVDLAQLLLGSAAALAGVMGLAALQDPQAAVRRPRLIAKLLWLALVDVVRSNIAVARIVLARHAHGARGERTGFVEIPLELKNPVGLAALACIITSTPGTSWAGYDPATGVFTLHVLDLVDEAEWIETIKGRYERLLLEIFE